MGVGVVVMLCLIALVSANALDAYEGAFVQFIKDFNRNYNEATYTKRFEIFKENLKYIEEFNSKNSHMQLGINDMTDMSHDEYLKLLQPFKQCPMFSPKTNKKSDFGGPIIPSSVDWRNQSDVGPVVDIRPNGGPAYAVVGSVQSWCSIGIYAGPFANYDPMQVIDCASGGWSATEEQVFEYVIQNGLHSTWNNCSVSRNTPGCCINDHICFGGLETALEVAVGLMGPTVVTIDASQPSFKQYKNGIYVEPACNSSNLNYNLLVVGYGSTPQGQEYWIAQNYWGTYWGQSGYIYMPKNQNDTCGIAACPCHPIGVHQCVR